MIQTLQSKKVYGGSIIDVYNDKVRLENGRIASRDVVRHRHASATLAIDDDMQVLVVRQHRYPIGKELIELPAGLIDEGENPLEAAKRELKEETGYIAKEWSELTQYYTSAGCHDEKLFLFLASDIEKVDEQSLDEGEILIYDKIPFEELYEMVISGKIADGKTIIGTLLAKKAYIKSK